MRIVTVLFWIFCLATFLVQAGCEPPEVATEPMPETFYVLAKAHILPLTEIIHADDAQGQSMVKIYVGLLDLFGSQIKALGVFRFSCMNIFSVLLSPRARELPFGQMLT